VKNVFILLILALICSLTASAALSEIRKEFPKQTTALPATAILAAPGGTASYLVCVYLSQPGASNKLGIILRWTDENSQSQSFKFSAASGVISNCDPIRNLAGTAPTVETSGTYPGKYDLFVVGFGFWTTGSQGQGGITEPFANWHLTAGPITLLAPLGAATYMIATDCSNGGPGILNWTDEVGAQTVTLSPSLSGTLIPVHLAAAKSLIFTSGSCYVSAVNMGTPKAGSGPLTDYELDLLNYTDVKWPSRVPVVSADSTTTYAFAANIAQVPNSQGHVLELSGDSLFVEILYAEDNGAPGNNDGTAATFPIGIVGAGYRSGSVNNPFTLTITTAINNGSLLGWGASPKYSAEVDVIQF
jgi:hypothetical protein